MLEPTLAVPLHEEVVPLAGRGGQGHWVSISDSIKNVLHMVT